MKTMLRWILYWYSALFGDGEFYADFGSRKSRFLAWVYEIDLDAELRAMRSSPSIQILQ